MIRITADGDKEWYLKGKRHRTDGPAIERPTDQTLVSERQTASNRRTCH
jgi:hypothetical protein